MKCVVGPFICWALYHIIKGPLEPATAGVISRYGWLLYITWFESAQATVAGQVRPIAVDECVAMDSTKLVPFVKTI